MKTMLLLLLVLVLGSCRPASIHEEYVSLPGEEWDRFEPVEFRYHAPDSGYYHISLCLRHSSAYNMSNLWCLLATRSTLVSEFKDSLDFRLTDAEGRWRGEGSNLKVLEKAIRKNPVYLPEGDVVFRIRHGMPMDRIKGIRDIGIRIEPVAPTRDTTEHNTDKGIYEEQTGQICGDGNTAECLPTETRGDFQD